MERVNAAQVDRRLASGGPVYEHDLLVALGNTCVGGLDADEVVAQLGTFKGQVELGLLQPRLRGCRVYSVTLTYDRVTSGLGLRLSDIVVRFEEAGKPLASVPVVTGVWKHSTVQLESFNDAAPRGVCCVVACVVACGAPHSWWLPGWLAG